jgi:hypothetical protein
MNKDRIRRAEIDVVKWAVAVVRRPNPDHAIHDRRLLEAVDEYEAATEARVAACTHPHAYPVSGPIPGRTEYRCDDCDSTFLRNDHPMT